MSKLTFAPQKTVAVIPTYNEIHSVRELLSRFAAARSAVEPMQLEAVIVDAKSNDGTAEAVVALQNEFPWLHLLRESKRRGLGAAYALGMQFAMETLKADFVLEFDGDLQHRPEDIPAVLASLADGYEMVLGSRFVSGGSIPQEWDWKRIALSRGGNLIARQVLETFEIHDMTTGFRVTKVGGLLENFDFSKLLSLRHAYKIHLLHFAVRSGARIHEVPICFELRAHGKTKLVTNDIMDTLKVLFSLRYRSVKGTRQWDKKVAKT